MTRERESEGEKERKRGKSKEKEREKERGVEGCETDTDMSTYSNTRLENSRKLRRRVETAHLCAHTPPQHTHTRTHTLTHTHNHSHTHIYTWGKEIPAVTGGWSHSDQSLSFDLPQGPLY